MRSKTCCGAKSPGRMDTGRRMEVNCTVFQGCAALTVGSAGSGCSGRSCFSSLELQLQVLPTLCPLQELGAGSQLNEVMQQLSISTDPSAVIPCLIKFVKPQAIHGEKVFSFCNKRKVWLSRGTKPDNEVILSRCILL